MSCFKKVFALFIILSFLCLPAFADEADHDGYIIKYKNSDKIEVVDEFPIMLYENSDEIEYIEPNYYYDLLGFEPTQNACYMSSSYNWNLKNIYADYMWKAGLYGNGIKVAVIDSGITVDDGLRRAVESVQSCVEGENIDNGSDISGHGTYVANIIASDWNAGEIVGIAPDVRIRGYKCFKMVNGKSRAAASDVTSAIDAAVADGCKVINMSLGSSQPTESIANAVNRAYAKGAILIAAAGNDGNEVINYPAGYSNVIGIGSVDVNNNISTFSNRNVSVFAVAPGTAVPLDVTTTEQGGKAILKGNGTSFSAPMVSAMAALCLCVNSSLNHTSFKNLLQMSCDDLGDDGYDTYYGYGIANGEKMFKNLMGTRKYFMSPLRRYNRDQIECTIHNFTDKDWNGYLFFKSEDEVNSTAFSASVGGYGTALFPYGTKTPENVFLWSNQLSPILRLNKRQ